MTASPAVEPASSVEDDVVIDVSIRYGGNTAIVAVCGELDALTAPDLQAVLVGVIGRGHRDVVLDLEGVTLLGAAGIRAIAVARAQARGDGGELAVRSPSRMSRRVLQACSMDELIGVDPLGEQEDDLAPGSPIVASLAMARANDMIDAVLGAFTAMAQEAVDGADGVSITLARSGQMTTVGASNETIAQMDRDQYSTGEGPCLAAAAQGERFHITSIATEGRWPRFVLRAKEDGIASILSTPLIVQDRPVGALNIYSNTDRAFGEADKDTASTFAAHAAAILSNPVVTMSDAEFAERMREALDTREVIAHAQGALMAAGGMTADDAFASLRLSARELETTIKERALEVLAPLVRSASGGFPR